MASSTFSRHDGVVVKDVYAAARKDFLSEGMGLGNAMFDEGFRRGIAFRLWLADQGLVQRPSSIGTPMPLLED